MGGQPQADRTGRGREPRHASVEWRGGCVIVVEGSRLSIFRISSSAILLRARRAKSWQPEVLNGALPSKELVNGKRIAVTGVLQRKQPTAHCRDYLRLAPNRPPRRGPGR